MLRLYRRIRKDVCAYRIGAEGRHILASSISAGVFEYGQHMVAFHIYFQLLQDSMMAVLTDDTLKIIQLKQHPVHEPAYLGQCAKLPDRRALYAFRSTYRCDAAA